MDAIIIIGAPGVGKGRFCDLAKQSSARIHHISTGNLIRGDRERQEATTSTRRQKIEQSEKQLKQQSSSEPKSSSSFSSCSSSPAPLLLLNCNSNKENKDETTLDEDDYINDLLMKRIESISSSNNSGSAERKSNSILLLDGYPRRRSQCEFLDKNKIILKIIQIVLLEVEDEEILLKRLLARGRWDDTREMIVRRLRDYRQITSKVLDYYGESKLLRVKTDSLNPKEVFETIRKQLEENGINL